MVGITTGIGQTYIVSGSFDSDQLTEGQLYYHPVTKRLFMYTTKEVRSNPRTGFYPIWNGTKTFIGKHSIEEYYPKDIIDINTDDLVKKFTKSNAQEIVYRQQRSMSGGPLTFQISDEDNFFTQCIKEIINKKAYTVIDLVHQSVPQLSDKQITNYCNALSKISFMRMDKWHIWLHNILHMKYEVAVFKEDRLIISYKEPDIFTVDRNFDEILNNKKMDPFKKLIKVTMLKENISKSDLRGEDIDEYTINNMMTILTGPKPVSAQLFSRFIRIADLSFELKIYDKDECLVTYRE